METDTQTKCCTKCGEVKLLCEFHKNKKGKYGRAPECSDCRKAYQDTPEVLLRKKEYDKKHVLKPHIIQNASNYHKTDKGKQWKRRANNSRRNSLLGLEGSHTTAEWLLVLEECNYTCLCCGGTDKPLTVDHVVPVSKGGTDDISNIQALCKSCNSKKGNHHSTDYSLKVKE